MTFTWSATGNITSQSIALETYEPTLLNGTPDERFNPERLSFGFTVVSNLPGSARSYTWTPPVDMQWTVRHVRVAVRDAEGQIAVATGPQQGLTTKPAPEVPPYVRVAYPSDPGITWHPGQSGFASWRADDPDGLAGSEVRLSTDGGATYPIVLATTTGNATTASFTVPNTPTTRARVKVTSRDTGNHSAAASSTNLFTIAGNAPTAVSLRSVSAVRTGRSVVLGWHTSNEARLLGFHVYRNGIAGRKRMSRTLIPAVGRLGGARYSFRDRSPGPGRRYWLLSVHASGSRSWSGPVQPSR